MRMLSSARSFQLRAIEYFGLGSYHTIVAALHFKAEKTAIKPVKKYKNRIVACRTGASKLFMKSGIRSGDLVIAYSLLHEISKPWW